MNKEQILGETYEKKADVKNGLLRFVFVIIAIILQIIFIVVVMDKVYDYREWVQRGMWLIRLLLILAIYSQNRTSSMKTPWIILIMAAPVTGITLYLLIGLSGSTDKMKGRFKNIDSRLMPLLPAGQKEMRELSRLDAGAGNLAYYLQKHAGFPVYRHTAIEYYDDGLKGLEAQKEELRKARKFIFMEYHAIEEAEAWKGILEILSQKAAEGLDVRIFYDDMGSISFITTDFVKRMQALGIRCRVFNPLMPGLNIFLNNRDHRKITVIDGCVGFTGGYNLADEYFHIKEPYGFWKDTGIRITGDAVKSLTAMFLEMWNAVHDGDEDDQYFDRFLIDTSGIGSGADPKVWNKVGGTVKDLQLREHKEREDGTPEEKALEEQKQQTDRRELEKLGEEYVQQIEEMRRGAGAEQELPGFVQPYADSPLDKECTGENVYISIAENAKRYVWFITPYLIITDEMIHAFGLAAKRGVDVRIITPGVPDKKIIYSVTRSYYNALTRNGVKIYEFTPGFCHAKMCVSDDVVATCGTINLDYRSLYHHFENGCVMYYLPAVLDIRNDFESTFAKCDDVTEYYTKGRGAVLRFGQLVLRLFAALM